MLLVYTFCFIFVFLFLFFNKKHYIIVNTLYAVVLLIFTFIISSLKMKLHVQSYLMWFYKFLEKFTEN